MEPVFENHRTEYQRLAATSRRRDHRTPRAVPTIDCQSTRSQGSRAGSTKSYKSGAQSARGRPNTGGSEVSWKFTGKAFTEGVSNRENELKHGCGIIPKVHPDDDPRVGEVPVRFRHEIGFATTALAAHGGYLPRQDKVDPDICRYKRQMTTWHEHDHGKSTAGRKELRPLRVAGLLSARHGYINTAPGHRVGLEDRPTWMSEDEDLPGGYLYTPSDPHGLLPEGSRGRGDPTRFGIDAHFTAQFVPTK